MAHILFIEIYNIWLIMSLDLSVIVKNLVCNLKISYFLYNCFCAWLWSNWFEFIVQYYKMEMLLTYCRLKESFEVYTMFLFFRIFIGWKPQEEWDIQRWKWQKVNFMTLFDLKLPRNSKFKYILIHVFPIIWLKWCLWRCLKSYSLVNRVKQKYT